MKNIKRSKINMIIDYIGLAESYDIFLKLTNIRLYKIMISAIEKFETPIFYDKEIEKKEYPFNIIGRIAIFNSTQKSQILSTAFLIDSKTVVSYLSKEVLQKSVSLFFLYNNLKIKIHKIVNHCDNIDKTVLLELESKIEGIDFKYIKEEFFGKGRYEIIKGIQYITLNIYSILNNKNDLLFHFLTMANNNIHERMIELYCSGIFNEELCGSPIFLRSTSENDILIGILIISSESKQLYCLRLFDCYFAKLVKPTISCPLTIYQIYFSIVDITTLDNFNTQQLSYFLANFSLLKIQDISIKLFKMSCLSKILILPNNCYFNLMRLVIFNCNMNLQGFKEILIKLSNYLTELKILIIMENILEIESDQVFSSLLNIKLKQLEEFNFSNNGIKLENLEGLSKLISQMNNLAYLNLSKNHISDQSLYPLSNAIKSLFKLKTLILEGNTIDDKGSNILSKDLNVLRLDLTNNHMSIEGEKILVQNLSKSTNIILSGKSMYGNKEEKKLFITEKKSKNNKVCCLIY